MELHHMKRKATLCVFVALMPASVWASSGPQGGGERRRPPQEAFDACNGKSEGTSVTITTPQGATIKATCKSFEGQLVAVPEGGPPPPPRDGGGNGAGN